jgi:hypothetical protein
MHLYTMRRILDEEAERESPFFQHRQKKESSFNQNRCEELFNKWIELLLCHVKGL